MIRSTITKLILLLTFIAIISAQENAAPRENSIPAQEVHAEVVPQAEKSSTQPPAPQKPVVAQNSSPNSQNVVVNQAAVQQPPVPPAPENPSATTPPADTPTPSAPQPEVPQTPSAQSVPATPQIIPESGASLQNLTQEQKMKLLHEEAVRAHLQSNKELKLSDVANMTVDEQLALQKKFAEESRIMYQKYKKEMEQRQAQKEAELQQLLTQALLSRSQEIQEQEKQKMKSIKDQWGDSMAHDQYMFELEPDSEEEFIISIPVAQKIGCALTTYSNEDGVYVRTIHADEETPLSIRVLENNHIVVYEHSFHFGDTFIIQGRDESTYTIKFINSEEHRLVSLRVTQVLQKSQIQSKLTGKDVRTYSSRTNRLYDQTVERFDGASSKMMLETSGKKKLTQKIETYYYYNIGEILVFIGLVLVQIEMIRKLLSSSSIV